MGVVVVEEGGSEFAGYVVGFVVVEEVGAGQGLLEVVFSAYFELGAVVAGCIEAGDLAGGFVDDGVEVVE